MYVAALQYHPVFLDVETNLDRLAAHIAACDAELLVLPELCTTGYFFHDVQQLRSVAEKRNGRTVSMFRDAAVENRRTIVAGFVELSATRLYNSAVTITPGGQCHFYRKSHLFAEERLLFTPGDSGFKVITVGNVRIGVMICYDWRFPEVARTLALKQAHIIVHPSDLVASPELWRPAMRVRSIENRVFTITANRIGEESRGDETLLFTGCSQIVAPSGKVLAEADAVSERWVIADIDPFDADRKAFSKWNDIMNDRRPELYEL
jgi:predicted amidohydrolase